MKRHLVEPALMFKSVAPLVDTTEKARVVALM